MRPLEAVSWVLTLCSGLRLSQAKTLAHLAAAAVVPGRALPLLGETHPKGRFRKSQNAIAEGLRVLLRGLAPRAVPVVILADRSFGRAELARTCPQLGLSYVVRIKPDVGVEHRRSTGLLSGYPVHKGIKHVLTGAVYRSDGAVTHNGVIHWRPGLPADRGPRPALVLDDGPGRRGGEVDRVVRPAEVTTRSARPSPSRSPSARPSGALTDRARVGDPGPSPPSPGRTSTRLADSSATTTSGTCGEAAAGHREHGPEGSCMGGRRQANQPEGGRCPRSGVAQSVLERTHCSGPGRRRRLSYLHLSRGIHRTALNRRSVAMSPLPKRPGILSPQPARLPAFSLGPSCPPTVARRRKDLPP
jgi:hypothetical protein